MLVVPRVGVPELPLDDVQRHALAGELERMRVPQLVWPESAPNPGACGDPAELTAHRRGRPRSPASGAVDNAEQGSHRQLGSHGQSWAKLFPAPPVYPYLAPSAALALADLHRTTPLVEVILAQRERFLDAQPRAPEHHDHRTQRPSVAIGDRVAITATISSTVGGSAG